jgi:hypothetical protein
MRYEELAMEQQMYSGYFGRTLVATLDDFTNLNCLELIDQRGGSEAKGQSDWQFKSCSPW